MKSILHEFFGSSQLYFLSYYHLLHFKKTLDFLTFAMIVILLLNYVSSIPSFLLPSLFTLKKKHSLKVIKRYRNIHLPNPKTNSKIEKSNEHKRIIGLSVKAGRFFKYMIELPLGRTLSWKTGTYFVI